MPFIDQPIRRCPVDNDPPIKRTNAPAIPDATAGQAYSHDFRDHFTDAGPLTFSLVGAPSWLVINDGVVSGTVPVGQTTPLTFTVVASDNQGLSSACAVSVDVITPGDPCAGVCITEDFEPLVVTQWDSITDGPGSNETTAIVDLADIEPDLAGLTMSVVPRDPSTSNEGTNAVGTVSVSGSVLTWIAPKGSACNEHRIRLSTVPSPNPCNCAPRILDLEVHAPSTDTPCILYQDQLVPQVGPSMRTGYGGAVDNQFLSEISGTSIEEFLGDYQDSGLNQQFAGPWLQAVDLSGNVMPNLRVREATTTALGLRVKESLLFDPANPTSAKYELGISAPDGQLLAAFGQTRTTYQNQPLGTANNYQTTDIDQAGNTFDVAFCFDDLQPIHGFAGLTVPRTWSPGELLVCVEWSP